MDILTGEQFQNLVKGAGLTVQQVCEHAKISQATVSKWAANKQSILLSTYVKLLDSFEAVKNAQQK